jgi:hypothetical protein
MWPLIQCCTTTPVSLLCVRVHSRAWHGQDMDTNHDGVVDRREFAAAMPVQGLSLKPQYEPKALVDWNAPAAPAILTAAATPPLIAHRRGLPPSALSKMLEDPDASVVLCGLKGPSLTIQIGAVGVSILILIPRAYIKASKQCGPQGSLSTNGSTTPPRLRSSLTTRFRKSERWHATHWGR